MEAGQGAAEQAQRIGERVSRLENELEQLEAELARARKAQQAWLAGADGEARVGEQLRQLELQGWMILHDVHWPGRPKANLDHIAVGPGGVLIIDAKNWSGDVHLRGGELYQNGHKRKSQTASALDQCAAVAALLEPQHRSMTQAWICLVGQPDLIGPTGTGVTVVGIDELVGTVLALPAVLEQSSVTAIHGYLKELLAGPTSPPAATTALLDSPKAESSLLAARRAAAVQSVPAGRPQAPIRTSSAKRTHQRRRKNQPSCLGAVWRLVLLALVLLFGAGALQNIAESLSTPPVPPSSSLVQPDVPRQLTEVRVFARNMGDDLRQWVSEVLQVEEVLEAVEEHEEVRGGVDDIGERALWPTRVVMPDAFGREIHVVSGTPCDRHVRRGCIPTCVEPVHLHLPHPSNRARTRIRNGTECGRIRYTN